MGAAVSSGYLGQPEVQRSQEAGARWGPEPELCAPQLQDSLELLQSFQPLGQGKTPGRMPISTLATSTWLLVRGSESCSSSLQDPESPELPAG